MKKNLLALLLSCLAVASVRADVVYTDTFSYSNGPIITVSTNLPTSTNWFHTGGATAADFFVNNHKAEISASGAGASRSEDVHCNFSTFTNTQTILYSSFTVNCTNLPPAVGTYIAHFYVNLSTFHARVFAQAGSLANTWRLGISGGANVVNKVFPVDLAPNADYQVVMQWDPTGFNAATLWVSPISSSDPNVISGDAVSSPAASLGFGFRQAGTFGTSFFVVSNLVVATTFEEAATNVWSTNAVSPVILASPKSGTNFVGDPVTLTGFANGQGIASITYQWQKNGANVANPNGNSNVFSIASAVVADTGNYRLIATTPFGLSATSAVASLWITNAPIPPSITGQPSNAPVFYHQSATLQVVASGPPTLTYQWYYTNAPATGANVSGADTDTLTVSDVFTNNGTTGAYYVVVSNPYGSKTSQIVNVTASGPPAVSIAFLRTLVDPVNYVATNSNLRWQATGVVTTFTNLTTGDTSSYYLQDNTGGINIFVTHGSTFRPNQGDEVTFTGWLSSFNSTLELEGDLNDPTTSFSIISNNAPLPAPKPIPFSITNNLAFCETNLEGSLVMITNVYFGTNAGTVISTTANTTITVTNAAGETFLVFFSSQDLDTAGQTLPEFASAVIGPFTQNLGNGVVPRNQGYSVTVTKFSDIITNVATPPTISISLSGGQVTITWSAGVLQQADVVAGPYTDVSPAPNSPYTIPAAGAKKFYRARL